MRHARVWCSLLLSMTLAAPLAAATETRETLTFTSYLRAEDRDHPSSHVVPLVLPEAYPEGARVCAGYENDIYQAGNRGRARLAVELWRDGAKMRKLGFGLRRHRQNRVDFGCRDAPPLARGDTLLYDLRFANMPRIEPRAFSRGGIVHTSITVVVRVEPPPPAEPSAIELLAVAPPFGSRVAAGTPIRVKVRYTCGQALGCNVAAGFAENGRQHEVLRGVAHGTRDRTLVMRCTNSSRSDLPKRGLLLEIQRSKISPPLDAAVVDGGFTCLSDNPWPASGAQP